MNGNQWLSIDEAAAFLRTDREEIEEMIRQKLIPHALLPISKNPLFSTHQLNRWLQGQAIAVQNESVGHGATREALKEMVLDRTRTRVVDRSRYTNLYAGTKVYAQLHAPTERKKAVYDGICLAIPEASNYEDLPEVKILELMDYRDLHGYWKANRDWLDGNGKRFKDHEAKAYHLPLGMAADPNHAGWSELDKLLDYARQKLEEKDKLARQRAISL